MRASRLRLLLVPAALLGLSAILVLARHVRRSTISARVAPAYIEPSPIFMLNGGRIFDAVLRGDWTRDDNVSVWFIGLPHPALRWEWETFHCSFAHGKLATVGSKYHALIDTQQEPYCPVPTAVAKALREGQLRTLVLSVYADKSHAEPIVQDIVIKPYARRYHRLAIHTMMKDEAAAIVEWIEFHRLLGVEHFYVYDNGSEDDILTRLQRYTDAGVVTYIHWPFRPDKGMHWNQVQNAGLNHMVKSFGAFNDWVGFMDVDEYFQPNASVGDALASGAATLTGMLDAELAAPRADGVLCDSLQFQMWQVSCDLGMRDIRNSRHTLLIEKCRQLDPRKVADPDKMRVVGKMFVKMEKVVTMRDIHFLGPSVKRGLSPDKQMTWPDFGRMRHYRAYREKGLLEFTDGRDDTMDRFIAPLREKIIHYD